MIRFVDTDAIADAYLAGLNACFPGWGNMRRFDWCFRRTAGGPAAELIVIETEGKPVAGSALLYRRIMTARGPARMACITGSWTLPEARRQGHFSRTIEAARVRAAERNSAMLVAWAAAPNGSVPYMAASSERVIETAYLTSGAGDAGPELPVITLDEAVKAFARRPAPEAIHLSYTPDEWRGQMVDRSQYPVEALALPGGEVALIERGPGRDLLLDLCGDLAELAPRLAASSRTRGNSLGAFSADPVTIATLEAQGFARVPGFFFLVPIAGAPPMPDGAWHFTNGDRM